MDRYRSRRAAAGAWLLGGLAALGGCGSDSGAGAASQGLPVLGAASPGTLKADACAAAATAFTHPGTTITSAATVAAGQLVTAGAITASPEHCLVTGRMNPRTSPVDGRPYAIGFEMRLPVSWNGRFFYQANGGIDGAVVTASGNPLGGAPVTTALNGGFAVISSDAGHPASYGPTFGLDPQARLDYGYNAVGQLTPMAKALINHAYGRGPDRSYIVGCSNGGRHALVAAARYPDQYDGVLAGNPGFNLPKAAVAQLYGVQQYAAIAAAGANGQPNISTALTPAEFGLVSSRITARCDALDGAADGLVADTAACQSTFDLGTDVPTCAGARDGSCLTVPQKTVLANILAGARNSAGAPIYASFPYDPGMSGADYADWEFNQSQNRDTGAVAFIFTTPPTSTAAFNAQSGVQYARAFSMDADAPRIFAAAAPDAESAMSFMTPPNPTDLSRLRARGAKLVVFHGTADAVFSPNDTAALFDGLGAANGGSAADFARYFPVPQMNHCRGGPATDQFDLLTPLVQWVEAGTAPDRVVARARGPGANVVNAEVPASWSPGRTRPLCPYPSVARYVGGDLESAASFACR